MRSAVLLFGLVFVCGMAVTAQAIPIFYVGVGNSTGADPQGKAADKLDAALKDAAKKLGQKYVSTVLKPKGGSEVGGTEITAALTNVASQAKPGDLVVFYYIGHGSTQNNDPGKEDNQGVTDNATTKGDEFVGTVADPLTDDALATSLGAIGTSVFKLAILDSCNSGGMVGGAEDLDRSTMRNLAYLLSTPEDSVDCGLHDFPKWLSPALTQNSSGKFPADTDGDGKVTLGEWVTYGLDQRTSTAGSGGVMGFTSWIQNDPRQYIMVPEPCTLDLLGIGLAGIGLRRRRCRVSSRA